MQHHMLLAAKQQLHQLHISLPAAASSQHCQ
jgi:hypothetical protein